MSNVKAAQQPLATFPNDVSISRSQFKGLESVVLENKLIRAEWISSYGAKMVSLTVKTGGGHELLYQTPLTKLVCARSSISTRCSTMTIGLVFKIAVAD
jgi:hypothetical protein